MISEKFNFSALEYPTEKRFYLITGEPFYWQISNPNGKYIAIWFPKTRKIQFDDNTPQLTQEEFLELTDFFNVLK